MKTIISSIEHVIDTAARFKNAYFFKSPRSAGERRSYEKYYSIPEFAWTENGDIYTAEFTVTCSCANVYARGHYTKNGKDTTLTAIKNSLKRLKTA